MDKKHYDIIVKGRVQGVWFRKFTKELAVQFKIMGFVRNEQDKSVFVAAEGSEEQLVKFVTNLKKGPPLSIVNAIDINESEVVGYSDFMITH